MSRSWCAAWLAVVCLSGWDELAAQPAVGLLPDRALVQLGTDRFRSRGSVQAIACSPDGRWVATVGNEMSAPVRIWDIETGIEQRRLNVTDDPQSRAVCVAISADGRKLAAGEVDGGVSVWSMPDGVLITREQPHSSRIQAIAFSPDGKYLVSGGEDGAIHVRTLEEIGPMFPLIFGEQGRQGDVFAEEGAVALAFTTDGSHLIAGFGKANQLRLWKCDGWELLRTINNGEALPETHYELRELYPLPNGRHVLVVGNKRVKRDTTDANSDLDWIPITQLRVWDVITGEFVRDMDLANQVYGFGYGAVSPDGKRVATCDYSALNLWDIPTGERLKSFSLPGVGGGLVGFTPDGKHILRGARHAIAVHNAESLQRVNQTDADSDDTSSAIAWSPDGMLLATCSDGTVRLWDAGSGRLLWAREFAPVVQLTGWRSSVQGIAFTPDGRSLIAGGRRDDPEKYETGLVRRFRVDTGATEWQRPLDKGVRSLALSQDGSVVVVGMRNGSLNETEVVIVAVDSGDVTTQFKRSAERGFWHIEALAFAPDNKSLWIVDGDSHILQWDVARGTQLQDISVDWRNEEERQRNKRSIPQVWQAAISGDASLAVFGNATTHYFWSLNDPRLVAQRPHGNDHGCNFALSPDGRLMAMVDVLYAGHPGQDTIRVFDVARAQVIVELLPGDTRAHVLSFSPDGRKLATAFDCGHTIIWDVTRE
jgi:WD40 repeat protein